MVRFVQVMRVIIFDQMGNVLSKFGCSKHLEFPNGVVVNDRQEIFISDNRAHCVKVKNPRSSARGVARSFELDANTSGLCVESIL